MRAAGKKKRDLFGKQTGFLLSSRGMTLPEVLIASSLAVLLLGLLLAWSVQGQVVIRACTVRSDELHELNHAMKVITETLQEGAVYLLEPHARIFSSQSEETGHPESRLLAERFMESYNMESYKRKEEQEFLLKDGYLLQRRRVKGPHGSEEGGGDPSPVLLETGEEEKVVASNIEEVTFFCPARGILEITIRGEKLTLTTQIRVKEGKEEE